MAARRPALAGWFFGFGYFLVGLYWIGHAFLVDAKTFGWLLPIAVTALPAGLAIFTAAGFALARLLWQRGPIRILASRRRTDIRRMAARTCAQRLSME